MKALGDVTIVDLEEKTLLGSHDDTAELPSDVSFVSVNSYLSFSILFISRDSHSFVSSLMYSPSGPQLSQIAAEIGPEP